MQVCELGGAAEGGRWFLDQFGLLPGPGAPQPVTIAGTAFALENADAAGPVAPTHVQEWAIARSNLLRESRPSEVSAIKIEDVVPATFPQVVLSGDRGQDPDAFEPGDDGRRT